MQQLLDDDQKLYKCNSCKQDIIGKDVLKHEKECKQKNQNNQQIQSQQQQANNFNQFQEYHASNQNQCSDKGIENQKNINPDYYYNQIRCDYCDLHFPCEKFKEHLKNCEAKAEIEKIKQEQFFSQIKSGKEQDDEKIIEILSQYFQIIDQYGDILQEGEELVKAANLSIEPFTKAFQQKQCRFCQQKFSLDEEIAILKCCLKQYHQICFAKNIISNSKNCECGKNIID